jgi:hypothetical protein
MKSSNLARRIEPAESALDSPPAAPIEREPRHDETHRRRVRARLERRTIETRDQGLAPFRVR